MRFPVWRELKLAENSPFAYGGHYLGMRFPVWRELKLSCSRQIPNETSHTWNAFSRLKGIETTSWTTEEHSDLDLECVFPFEGNWNWITADWVLYFRSLGMRFPVWRELKQRARHSHRKCRFLECVFPFEGNWNDDEAAEKLSFALLGMRFPVWRELKPFKILEYTMHFPFAWNAFSRLKGIETKLPVGGLYSLYILGMRFPVWRELKQQLRHLLGIEMDSWNAFSRLKGMETCEKHLLHSVSLLLECVFPFEGNGNVAIM